MKIFTEDILDVQGKDYPSPTKKTDIEKMAILAIIVIAVGFIFTHVLIEFGAVMAILVLVGMYALYQITSLLIG